MKLNKLLFKIPKDAGWLLPGLEVKRWFVLIITGAIIAAIGLCIIANLRPIYTLINMIMELAQMLPPKIIGWVMIVVGVIFFYIGWLKTNYSILDANNERNRHAVLEDLYRRRKLNRGPKIVAIGGGTGLSTMLKGIKKITNNITAVVTVGGDGGSSGKLREELGVLPPGDIRSCIAALADDEDLVAKLFQYRFKDCAGLSGHSFGNLFITAMCETTGNMVKAVQESSKVLSIRGRVLPSTLDDMRLVAEMEDGSIIKGESNIPESGKKIKTLFTEPNNCKPLEDVIFAINDADLIILGPGSLYTSVIPNLLIKEISEEIIKSSAKKIYVCNIMTQPGESDDYAVSDHLNALYKHAGSDKLVDAVLVNNNLPKNISKKYEECGQFPVILDKQNVHVDIVEKKLIEENKNGLIRHSSYKVARAVYYWFRKSQKEDKKKQR